MEQLAARWAHNPKVVGSSPAPATKRSVFTGLFYLLELRKPLPILLIFCFPNFGVYQYFIAKKSETHLFPNCFSLTFIYFSFFQLQYCNSILEVKILNKFDVRPDKN